MILIDENSTIDLDQLAKQHFETLILPQNKKGSYHATQSLIGRTKKQLDKDVLFPNRVKFWNYFLQNHYVNLERTICSRPKVLSDIIIEIENLVGHNILTNNISYRRASLTPFGNIVSNVFGYSNYRDNGLAERKC
ncbi:hypothetical protein N7U66_00300 [Lacinutrix neustonica]|uniref:Uncharacterized protein n=1 Tax=Lacinutrix neustonica TaxID=2980107 RepID=A0A9E8MXA7_9FLAO|nr:hypothetical protein [Lacinutrix neustonica]WAC02262.1 hypothetical protein N7U66_00300 [Lacinutrix neustonica]